MYMTGRGSSFLKGYSRHLRLGMRASGGSLYLITTPRNVFVSSVSAPDSSKLGFSLSAGGSFASSLPPSGSPKSCSWFSLRLWWFSLRRSSCCRLSACWEANAPRSLCLSPPCSLSWGLSDSHLLRLSSGWSFLLLRSSPLARCSSRSRFILTSAPRWGLRLLLFLGDPLLRLAGDVSLLPGERSLVLAGDLLVLRLGGLELPLDLDLERRDLCGLTGLTLSCLILTLDSRSGDSLLLCRFSLVILQELH